MMCNVIMCNVITSNVIMCLRDPASQRTFDFFPAIQDTR